MRLFSTRIALCLALSACCCACSGEGVNRKKTFPVKGRVLVDGQPAENLAVRCVDVKGLDKENPTTSSSFTDKDGNFQISTYQQGDGVPEGDYVLTFEWGEMNMFTMSYGGPDKLNERYNTAEKSPTKFTVKAGQPTDLGEIKLTTK